MPLIEFSHDNSYHSSNGITPFEAFYGRRCRSHLGWFEAGEVNLIGPSLCMRLLKRLNLFMRG